MSSETVLGQLVQLGIRAPQSDWSGLFDRFQVFRSTLGEGGPYTELTAPSWQAPFLPTTAGLPPSSPVTGTSVPLNGLPLNLLLDETTALTITFSGSNPISFSSAASQVIAQGRDLVIAYVDALGNFVVQALQPGNGSILRVVGGDAAPLLNLPTSEPQSVTFGKDARPLLVSGQDNYIFLDAHGSNQYFYKTRYWNSASNVFGEYSPPFRPSKANLPQVITGTLTLLDAQGNPLQNRRVSLYPTAYTLAGNSAAIASTEIVACTDCNGFVFFQLLRGLTVRVAVAGTLIVREVTVPTDPTISTFNLLDPSVGSDDVFTVQQPNIDYAVRRTL